MLNLTFAATVHISVLGSFHPVQLNLQPARGAVLMVQMAGHTETLEGANSLTLSGPAKVAGKAGAPVRFKLSVEGRVEREYFGRLEVRKQDGELLAIVEMDRETAVASIVAAEGAGGMPLEARKAQAVVVRSYLAGAHGRHEGFDFCDTTHCQLLAAPPAPGSAAKVAAEATRGQMLVYHGSVVATVYSANCGGHTKTLAQAGWQGAGLQGDKYPYFSVTCPRAGHASGHGIGFCQMGAIEIALHGSPARIILGHYFPQTTIETAQETMTPRAAMHTSSMHTTAMHTAAMILRPASAGMGVRAVR